MFECYRQSKLSADSFTQVSSSGHQGEPALFRAKAPDRICERRFDCLETDRDKCDG
jgi:hypothetical protein